jgi:hypothetical protein
MLKFEFTAQQLQVIAQALAEIPFKHANPLLQELQKQYDAQKKVNDDVPDEHGRSEPSTPAHRGKKNLSPDGVK